MPNLNSGFAVRDVADVTFRALAPTDIGNTHFDKMQPVLEITTATTSSLEGAATTTYAQGGRGNARIVAFDGERTLTVSLENSILSGKSFSLLSGAGVFETSGDEKDAAIVPVVYDATAQVKDGATTVVLKAADRKNHKIVADEDHAPYAVLLDSAGGQKQFFPALRHEDATDDLLSGDITFTIDPYGEAVSDGDPIRVYCYELRPSGVSVYTIAADKFAGTYYIEMDTLYKDVETGLDFPAKIVIPRGKIQSNFTLTMSASGDPSTTTITIDCLEGFVKYGNGAGRNEKVLAALILDQGEVGAEAHPYDKDPDSLHEYTQSEDFAKTHNADTNRDGSNGGEDRVTSGQSKSRKGSSADSGDQG